MIPHNNELQAKFGKRGLVVVGVTDEPDGLVSKYVTDNKIAYPIVIEKGFKSSRELKVAGFPSSFLVDTKGKVIWAGHPASLKESDIEEALKGARAPGVKLPAALKSLEPLLQKQDYAKAYEAAKNLMAGNLDEEGKKAAQEVLDNIANDAKSAMADAEKNLGEKRFYEAQEDLTKLVKSYANVPGAEGADAKLRELKANSEAIKSIKAGEQLAKANDLAQSQDFDKAYAMLKSITMTAPGTVPATDASARMREFESGNLLGFDKKCDACLEKGKACLKHRKKPK
jgi:hypothetical protein